MAALARLGEKISICLAVGILASWIVTALSLTAINILNTEATFTAQAASISLLTFLVCRLLVRLQPGAANEGRTIAHLLATADYGSRRGALILISFCSTWLYELLTKGVLLVLVTVFGAVMATVIYNDPNFSEDWQTEPVADQPQRTAALVEIDKFKEEVGFDPTQLFRSIPPQALVYFIVLVWFNFISLGLYILGHGLKAFCRVLGFTVTRTTSKDTSKDASTAQGSPEKGPDERVD
ncbi:hypothetical protein AbraIFM66950_007116 [Aspergillus brasiliensis]|nr:hypothetical protein AbraIFM66950_007116 [Aspergillus brasiliensis]